jgi:NitT/TauT family transport system permease protein
VRRALKGAILPITLLIAWEVAMRVNHVQSDSLAPPSKIAVAFVGAIADGSIFQATRQTLQSAVAGLAVGGIAGLLASIALGLLPPAARLSRFSIEVLRPVPAVALIPVALLTLGFGYSMEISLVAFACFWPVLIYGQAAVSNIDPLLLDVGKVLRLRPFARITKIVLPATIPRYFVAFRLAAALSLVIAVTVEIAANPLGVGNALMVAAQSLHPALMFAMLLWIGLIGWVLNWLLLLAQRRLFGRLGAGGAAQ